MEQDIHNEQSNSIIDAIRQRQNEEREKLQALQIKVQEIMRSCKEIEENIAAYDKEIKLELKRQPQQ